MNRRMDWIMILMGAGFLVAVLGVALQAPIAVIVGFVALLAALLLTAF